MSSRATTKTDKTNQLIWDAVRRIPPGKVCTYGQVAKTVGLGRAARRVGRALRELPENSDVPWHRVLRADGRLAFAPGSGVFQQQVQRLTDEGVCLSAGRVDLHRFGSRPDLDQLLWGR